MDEMNVTVGSGLALVLELLMSMGNGNQSPPGGPYARLPARSIKKDGILKKQSIYLFSYTNKSIIKH